MKKTTVTFRRAGNNLSVEVDKELIASMAVADEDVTDIIDDIIADIKKVVGDGVED